MQTARYAPMMSEDEALAQLLSYVLSGQRSPMTVYRVTGYLDEMLDGHPVVRLTVMLDEPDGATWNLDALRDLRHDLSRRSIALGLPEVSVTHVAKSEAYLVSEFSQ